MKMNDGMIQSHFCRTRYFISHLFISYFIYILSFLNSRIVCVALIKGVENYITGFKYF